MNGRTIGGVPVKQVAERPLLSKPVQIFIAAMVFTVCAGFAFLIGVGLYMTTSEDYFVRTVESESGITYECIYAHVEGSSELDCIPYR